MQTVLLLTTTLGLEGAVALEAKEKGFKIVRSESGRVFVDAGYGDIPVFNVNIRSVERVLYVIGEFESRTFDDLYEGIRSIDWSFLRNPRIWVARVRSVSSKLFSERAVQSVAMKAIADAVKEVDGEIPYPVHIYLRRDRAVVAVDSSGFGLHRRGYRIKYSKAPLRETIAAALLILARYSDQPFHDPFCGSGTIAIEAALIASSIPPNAGKAFSSRNWKGLEEIYEVVEKDVLRRVKPAKVPIKCSDIDGEVLKVARENAERAGVEIEVFESDFRKVRGKGYGKIVTNPPYGKRLSGVWKDFRELFENFGGWEKHFISPVKEIWKVVGERPRKITPFFNSGVEVFYHQYF